MISAALLAYITTGIALVAWLNIKQYARLTCADILVWPVWIIISLINGGAKNFINGFTEGWRKDRDRAGGLMVASKKRKRGF